MFNVMSVELKRLGVPFFGVKPELVHSSSDADNIGPDASSRVRIHEDELLTLQQRMIAYLQDMYNA